MANLTLIDIARINGHDDVVGLIEDTIQAHPEMLGPGRTINGTVYKSLVRTALPASGFRNANEGTAAVKSTYETKLTETFIFDVQMEADRAVADAHEDGPEAVMAFEAAGAIESAMRNLASQFYYGKSTTVATSTASAPTKGFPGLIDIVDSSLVYDAGGALSSVRSSVWAVKWGAQNVSWVYGNGGSLTVDPMSLVRVTDSNSNPYDAYRRTLLAYPGLQATNKNSIGRIKNLDTTTTLNDDMIYELLSQFPTGIVPDVLYMSRRSLKQLRASRTATNVTGAPAPNPTDVAGIPIAVTDAIVNTESA